MRNFGPPFPLGNQEHSPNMPDDIAYHIKLGDEGRSQLQVSTAAHQAYGLVPFTGETQEGARQDEQLDLRRPSINVMLVGPDEEDAFDALPPEANVRVMTDARKGAVDVVVGFQAGVEEATEAMVHGIKQTLSEGLQYEPDEDELPTGPHGEPFREILGHDLPQIYAHGLVTATRAAAADALADYGRVTLANDVYYRFKGLLVETAVNGTIIVGVTSEIAGRLSPAGLVTAAGIAGINGARALNLFRGYARHMEADRARPLDSSAQDRADEVSDVIHRIYCRTHFDRQLDLDDPDEQ